MEPIQIIRNTAPTDCPLRGMTQNCSQGSTYKVKDPKYIWHHTFRCWDYGLVLEALSSKPAPAKVLDTGCGRSPLPKLLVSMGYDVVCQDIDAEAVGLQRMAGARGTTQDLLQIEEKFDVVILISSIEHFTDSMVTLRAYARHALSIVNKGGILVVTTDVNGTSVSERAPTMWTLGENDVRAMFIEDDEFTFLGDSPSNKAKKFHEGFGHTNDPDVFWQQYGKEPRHTFLFMALQRLR